MRKMKEKMKLPPPPPPKAPCHSQAFALRHTARRAPGQEFGRTQKPWHPRALQLPSFASYYSRKACSDSCPETLHVAASSGMEIRLWLSRITRTVLGPCTYRNFFETPCWSWIWRISLHKSWVCVLTLCPTKARSNCFILKLPLKAEFL